MDSREHLEWLIKAALLDPNAFDYMRGNGLTLNVPVGEIMLAANLMFIQDGMSPMGHFYHRSLHVDKAMPLPPGTSLTTRTDTGFPGYIHYCRPALVMADKRYRNPKDLYLERMYRLRYEFPLSIIRVVIPAGTPMSPSSGRQLAQDFPTDFENAMLMHVAAEDVAWAILHRGPGLGGVNTFGEINNEHRIREAENVLLPFKRSMFTRVMASGANTSGNDTDPTIAGQATFHYVKLPDSGF